MKLRLFKSQTNIKQMPYKNYRQKLLRQQLNAPFAIGVGSILCIRSRYGIFRISSPAADRRALAGYWKRVGD